MERRLRGGAKTDVFLRGRGVSKPLLGDAEARNYYAALSSLTIRERALGGRDGRITLYGDDDWTVGAIIHPIRTQM